MSLINQMLRDIEQRESRAGAMSVQAFGTQHDPDGAAWMPQATRWGLSGFMALTALGAVTGGGAVWWWTAQPAAAVKAAMVAAPAPMVNPSGPPMTAAAPPPVAMALPPQEPAPAHEPAQVTVQIQAQTREDAKARPQPQPQLQSKAVAAVAAPTPGARDISGSRDTRDTRDNREASAQIKPAPPATQTTATFAVDKPSPVQPGRAATAPVTPGATATVGTPRASPPTPTRAEPLYQQALAESKQSQPELALKSLREALEIQPSHLQARLVLARLLVEKKQPDAAADLLSDGLMLLPQQSRFALALAPLWFASNRQDEAMGLLAQSASSADASPDYHVYYASQLLRLKRFADAGKHYRIALRSNPAMVDWLIGLGLSLQGTSNEKEAMDVFKRAIDTGTLTGQKRELVEQMITGLKARVGS